MMQNGPNSKLFGIYWIRILAKKAELSGNIGLFKYIRNIEKVKGNITHISNIFIGY